MIGIAVKRERGVIVVIVVVLITIVRFTVRFTIRLTIRYAIVLVLEAKKSNTCHVLDLVILYDTSVQKQKHLSHVGTKLMLFNNKNLFEKMVLPLIKGRITIIEIGDTSHLLVILKDISGQKQKHLSHLRLME